MYIDFLLNVFKENSEQDAIIWRDKAYTYERVLQLIAEREVALGSWKIGAGTVVAVEGDFSPNTIALMLSLIEKSCIIVPLNNSVLKNKELLLKIAQVEFIFSVDKKDDVSAEQRPIVAGNEFYLSLRQRQRPGLVLFTSGTSGKPKGAVHDFLLLLEKFKTRRKGLKTLNFLLFDHWGGLNTMFHILSNGGTVIATQDRLPDSVCAFVEKYRIELLPTSPTFLNLLLISEAYKRYDLSSLKIISYGTEPMPENTLKKMNSLFPSVLFQQTYGLIELGVLRSKSKSSDSLWLKIGGEGFETRVIDGILQIKAQSAMMGYLNAESPFTEDGWYVTGDAVEVDGEYIKFLGRKTECINVGGEKVYPTEIENVIQEMDNVAEVRIFREANPITGNIVCAEVRLVEDEDPKEFAKRLKRYCFHKIEAYKVPVKVKVAAEKQHGDRFKKIRR